MIRLSPAVRISIGLVFITMSILMAGNFIGLIPDKSGVTMEARKNTARTLAVQCTLAVRNNNIAELRKSMGEIVKLHPDILSLGIRVTDGKYQAQTGDHKTHWVPPSGEESTSTHWQVPIYSGEKRWGTLEMSFTPQNTLVVLGHEVSQFTLMLLFFTFASLAGFLIFMKRTLRDLDPTTVMPGRVKYALDTLTEGVIIVDMKDRIILVNSAFAVKLGCPVKSLMGLKASDLYWSDPKTKRMSRELPWVKAISQGEIQSDISLNLDTRVNGVLNFTVNCAPILDDKGKSRGALATFDDVTAMEKKNKQLTEALELLKKSSDRVEQQNRELEVLATQDPLTGCLNRRAFFEKTKLYLKGAVSEGSPLSCVMTDIDLFKSINDQYGHAVGDHVIHYIASTLQMAVRGEDAVCRYGGEEFCLLLPNCDMDNAAAIAERIRLKIGEQGPRKIAGAPGIRIAASFGISDSSLGAQSIEELIAQADRALYRAKETGRNRVVCWDGDTEPESLNQPDGGVIP